MLEVDLAADGLAANAFMVTHIATARGSSHLDGNRLDLQ